MPDTPPHEEVSEKSEARGSEISEGGVSEFSETKTSQNEHIPPDFVVEHAGCSLKASGREDLQIEEPIACG
jgi:hypothetical protein